MGLQDHFPVSIQNMSSKIWIEKTPENSPNGNIQTPLPLISNISIKRAWLMDSGPTVITYKVARLVVSNIFHFP